MTKRFARTRVPSDNDEGCLMWRATETGRASAGETATGEKCIEFQCIESGIGFFALHMEEELDWKQI